MTCEEYGFKGRGCIGILIKNDMPVEEIEILSKDVEIDGEIYTLSSSVKYKNNCITETSTSISVDEDVKLIPIHLGRKGLNPNHHCPYMELKFRIICFPTIPIKCRKPFLIYYFLFRLDWILV